MRFKYRRAVVAQRPDGYKTAVILNDGLLERRITIKDGKKFIPLAVPPHRQGKIVPDTKWLSVIAYHIFSRNTEITPGGWILAVANMFGLQNKLSICGCTKIFDLNSVKICTFCGFTRKSATAIIRSPSIAGEMM